MARKQPGRTRDDRTADPTPEGDPAGGEDTTADYGPLADRRGADTPPPDDSADFGEEHTPSPTDPSPARLFTEYDDSFEDPTGA